MNEYFCSVIIPVFNGEKFLAAAIDSVLMQKTSYQFEIIIVNDGSTDNSGKIAKKYASKFNNIVLLENEENKGKGFSFMKAYEKARGLYFHVLDADDIFTNRNKLHKQIDFLEKNQEYIAVTHNSLIIYENNQAEILIKIDEEKTYSYDQYILSGFYAHTSAIMFRKIVKKLPNYFLLKPFRGDAAVFLFHMLKTKGKVKYFPDIWSVYNWHGDGIWTSMEKDKQKKLNFDVYSYAQEFMVCNMSSPEWQLMQQRLDALEENKDDDTSKQFININDIIKTCIHHCAHIFDDKNYFNAVYSSLVVDQVAEALGRYTILSKGLSLLNTPHNNIAVIATSGLSKNGGGIYNELMILSESLLTKYDKLYIVSSSLVKAPEHDWAEAFNDPHIEIIHIDEALDDSEKISTLIDIFYQLRPKVIYPFITHIDIPLNAAIQSGLAGNIIINFVYDHGLVLGLNNSAIDSFIVKNDSQRDAINAHILNAKFITCAPLLIDKFQDSKFTPYKNNILTTASASARSYKTTSQSLYNFNSIVAAIAKKSNGIHYHYGKLSEEELENFKAAFIEFGIYLKQFIHIEWADNLGQSMLDNGVDLFVTTFPICSARIGVEVMSAGIPILNHYVTNPSIYPPADFCDPNQFLWHHKEDLLDIISSLDANTLIEKSQSARQWFVAHNDYKLNANNLITLSAKPEPVCKNPLIYIYDYDVITQTNFFLNLFDAIRYAYVHWDLADQQPIDLNSILLEISEKNTLDMQNMSHALSETKQINANILNNIQYINNEMHNINNEMHNINNEMHNINNEMHSRFVKNEKLLARLDDKRLSRRFKKFIKKLCFK